jgi:hypothetical protein
MRAILITSLFVSTALLTNAAVAQDDPVPTPEDAKVEGTVEAEVLADAEEKKRKDGWAPGIQLGASFNLVDNRSVVGQIDGTTITLGGGIDAALDFNSGIHEWRNSLVAAAGVTRTPSIDEFVKTNDGLRFESIYLMHIYEIFGPFARFALNSQMFAANDIQATPVNYEVSNLDGTTDNFTGRRLALTDPFRPTTLRESLGVFLQPVRMTQITLETRVGLGALQTFASGFAVNDDGDTADVVEVEELDDSFMVGGEGVLNMWGFFDDAKRLAYTAGIGVLVPFVTSELAEDDDRNLAELTALEANVGLNAKLFDWASLGYLLTVNRQPLLVDAFQVSNSLLITIGAAFGSKAPEPEKPVCDCEKAQPVVLEPKSSTEATETKPGEPAPAGTAAEPAPAEAAPAEPAPAEPGPEPAPAEPAPAEPAPAEPAPEPDPG